MKSESAAGRKTDRADRAARRYEAQLETQLELLTDAMRGSVSRADTVEDDEYGHRRDSHIGQAVKIGTVSAHIVVALSKLGGEFNHNIHVKRSGEDEAAGKPYVVELNSNPKIRRVYPSREAYEIGQAARSHSLSSSPPDHWIHGTMPSAMRRSTRQLKQNQTRQTRQRGYPPTKILVRMLSPLPAGSAADSPKCQSPQTRSL